MTSYEIQIIINEFFDQRKKNYLLETVESMSQMFLTLIRANVELYLSKPKFDKSEPTVTEQIKFIEAEIRKLKPRELFRQFDFWEEFFLKIKLWRTSAFFTDISVVMDKNIIGIPLNSLPHDFNNLLNIFSKKYEEFFETPNVENIFSLLKQAHNLHLIFTTIFVVLEDISEKLNIAFIETDSNNQKSLSIFLYPKNSLETFIAKLESLNVIYIELCRLLDVSTAEYPLRVIKIESGSLWIKLFGESKVIALMTELIKEAAGFVYRNFTAEGKPISNTRQVEGIEILLNLESRMKGLGYDTGEIRESITKSAVVIAKKHNILLAGEAKIIVNDETFSVSSATTQLIAERMTNYFVEDNYEDRKLLVEGNSKDGNDETF